MSLQPSSQILGLKTKILCYVCSCAACRGRKARCVPNTHGPCQRCSKSGLTCVFEETEPWKSNSRLAGRGSSEHAPSNARREMGQEQHLSRSDAEVRVLGEFAGSPVESFYSNARTGSDPRSPDEVSANQTDQAKRLVTQETSPVSGELEGAILLVEEPGRTRE